MATFTGTVSNDNLVGTIVDDIFVFSAGNDTLNGGAGLDTVNYTGLNQAVVLQAQGILQKGGGAFDRLIGIDTIVGQAGLANRIDASTNPATVTINANLATNSLTVNNIPNIGNLSFNVQNFTDVAGGAGNDTLAGSAANNNLVGGDGNDTFIFSAGNDTINGGAGIDTVNYTGLNQAIVLQPQGVLQKGGGAFDRLIGIDTIIGQAGLVNRISASTNPAAVSIIANLATNSLIVNNIPNIGNLSFNVQNFVDVAGGAGNDSITGNTANNSLIGGDGNDLLRDALGNDSLVGGAGNDDMYAGAGTDTLVGGTGDDAYFISIGSDTSNDTIVELANEGNDTAYSVLTVTALAANVENLFLTGSAAINGTGNNLNNFIEGNSGNNILSGADGNDVLRDNLGNDSLVGGAGNDDMYAGAGTDTLVGGTGDDAYFISIGSDTSNDVIIELANEGNDTAYSVLTVTALTANVENLFLTGSAAINGTGNNLSNYIQGNTANNVINGGAGNDTFRGDAGSDSFVFSGGSLSGTVTSLLGVDTVVDFVSNVDKLVLSKTTFSAITSAVGGAIGANFAVVTNDTLVAGSAASIVYSQGSNQLFYNQNGAAIGVGTNGGAFANLTGVNSLSANDFNIVA